MSKTRKTLMVCFVICVVSFLIIAISEMRSEGSVSLTTSGGILSMTIAIFANLLSKPKDKD